MIEISHVSYDYDGRTPALDDVSVSFPRGTVSAVLGESGSGKTTLLMCVGQFLRPRQGQITFDGQDIYAIGEKQFRRSVGIVFQKLYLFPHLTVEQNMMLAAKHVLGLDCRQAHSQTMEMLERLGIVEIADSYPSAISGGQAQRAAIARGLLLRPDYMLLDEPTSALDVNTTDEFARWLSDLRETTNFIIVTHDTQFARQVANTAVYLSGGRILDCGDVDSIIAHVRAGRLVNSRT